MGVNVIVCDSGGPRHAFGHLSFFFGLIYDDVMNILYYRRSHLISDTIAALHTWVVFPH
jgi:hypothetical protein